jgi:hypothetical protein
VLFEGGFKESVPVDISTDDIGATSTDDYGYESDSDLELVSEDESEPDDIEDGADAQLTNDAGELFSV